MVDGLRRVKGLLAQRFSVYLCSSPTHQPTPVLKAEFPFLIKDHFLNTYLWCSSFPLGHKDLVTSEGVLGTQSCTGSRGRRYEHTAWHFVHARGR